MSDDESKVAHIRDAMMARKAAEQSATQTSVLGSLGVQVNTTAFYEAEQKQRAKVSALQFACPDGSDMYLDRAKAIYAWLTE